MALIYLYRNDENRFEIYDLNEDDQMPYVIMNSMSVAEFRGSSQSNVLWTTLDCIKAWNRTRTEFGPIPFRYAFKRIWEGGHGDQSQHYAGVAFDCGQVLSQEERNRLHTIATRLDVWSYVEPLYLTPTWVHFDKRYGQSACSAGYPLLRKGDRGIYVLIMQDALNALGYNTRFLDGNFGERSEEALLRFQSSQGLVNDGICGCETWRRLTALAKGIGLTDTVIEP